MRTFDEFLKKKMNEMDGDAKALFDAGAHGAGRQTKKKSSYHPDHPESLMDIGTRLDPKDRGFSSDREQGDQEKMRMSAADFYQSKNDNIARIIDNLIRQDDKMFPPKDNITEDELIQRLRSLKTRPDAGYKGGEDIKLIPDDKVKEAFTRMTAVAPTYKILSFLPSPKGKSYVILKGKRDINPEEETTTRPGRYQNPNQVAAAKGMSMGGVHPAVIEGEKAVKGKLDIFKREFENSMKSGFGVPAAKELFRSINELEGNSFVQPDRKEKYKGLKMQVRKMLDHFEQTHGQGSLAKMKPQPTGDNMFAKASQPAGIPVKAPMAPAQGQFAMAREWEELAGFGEELNG